MRLPMQGKKLLPRQQYIVRRGLGLHTPNGDGRDRALDARPQRFVTARGERGIELLAADRVVMRENVDQYGLRLLGISVAELEVRQLFEGFAEWRWVIKYRLEDQRFARWHHAVVTPREGARGPIGAYCPLRLA